MRFVLTAVFVAVASTAPGADLGSPIPLEKRVEALEQKVAELEKKMGSAHLVGPASRRSSEQPDRRDAGPTGSTYHLVNGQFVSGAMGTSSGCYTDASGRTVCPTGGHVGYSQPTYRGPVRRILGR